jgi:hypothetical protein
MAYGCCNLVVADCTPLKGSLLADYIPGDPAVLLDISPEELAGTAVLEFNDGCIEIDPASGAEVTSGQWEYALATPFPLPVVAQPLSAVVDCLWGIRRQQICRFSHASVSARGNKFTYQGDLGTTQLELAGFWQNKPLRPGNYIAYLKQDDIPALIPMGTRSITTAPDGWVEGSIRIIPWAQSRLRYKPFGAKLFGLWSTAPLVDPAVNTYLPGLL